IRLARLALEIDSYCWCSTVTEPSSFVVTTAMMESLRKYLIFSEDILLSLVTVASRYDIAHCCQWAIALQLLRIVLPVEQVIRILELPEARNRPAENAHKEPFPLLSGHVIGEHREVSA